MNDYGGSSDVGATGRETCAYVKSLFRTNDESEFLIKVGDLKSDIYKFIKPQ